MINQFSHLHVVRVVLQFYYEGQPELLYKMPFSGIKAFHAYLYKHPEVIPKQVLMRYELDSDVSSSYINR